MLRQTLQRFGFSGNDVNERHPYTNHRARPLHEAARAYDERAVALLLAAGAEVDGLNDLGMSPLQWACADSRHSRNYNLGVSRLLIAANADVNHRDTKFGNTVLHWAMVRGHEAGDPLDAVTMLIEAGADVTLPNDRGWTPYAVALNNNSYRRILRVLLQHGAVPDAHVHRRTHQNEPTWLYHDKVKAAGGYDALVKQHRRILASVVDKVVES